MNMQHAKISTPLIQINTIVSLLTKRLKKKLDGNYTRIL